MTDRFYADVQRRHFSAGTLFFNSTATSHRGGGWRIWKGEAIANPHFHWSRTAP